MGIVVHAQYFVTMFLVSHVVEASSDSDCDMLVSVICILTESLFNFIYNGCKILLNG